MPASEAYISELHILCREYAQTHYDSWFILSAKYGLLAPTDLVPAFYDITFDRPSDPVVSDEKLAEQISRIHALEVGLLLPRDYANRVRVAFKEHGVVVHQPFAQMKDIGEIRDYLRDWRGH